MASSSELETLETLVVQVVEAEVTFQTKVQELASRIIKECADTNTVAYETVHFDFQYNKNKSGDYVKASQILVTVLTMLENEIGKRNYTQNTNRIRQIKSTRENLIRCIALEGQLSLIIFENLEKPIKSRTIPSNLNIYNLGWLPVDKNLALIPYRNIASYLAEKETKKQEKRQVCRYL